MKHRDLSPDYLPDNRLGYAIAAVLCIVLHVHSRPCRGTSRCSRVRFGVPFGHDGPVAGGSIWDEYDGEEEAICTWCGGEPDMQECDDPIQCCDPRCDGTWHPCVACNGTGRASEQWCW